MADPLSITASVLAIVTAAVQTTRSLNDALQRYKSRDKTLRRLQDELKDLIDILESLKSVSSLEIPILSLLKGPVDRCSQLCREFERSMGEFGKKSETGFRDWAKMEFMRGSINEFIDTLTGYKLTISVGLGTITMHTSSLSQKVLEEYCEVIQDTTHALNIHLQRIDEKMAPLTKSSAKTSDTSIDLEDEMAVTRQCLRICEDARSYLESVMDEDPCLQGSKTPKTTSPTSSSRNEFDAQTFTRKALNDYRDQFAETIGRLQERLDALARDGSPRSERDRLLLEKDLETSRQCLKVCKEASDEVSYRKIYQVGEAVTEGNSDQVLVTSLADLFDVRKALSQGKSAQLLGFMKDETIQQLSADRYSSRFGTHSNGVGDVEFSASSSTQTTTLATRQQDKREEQHADAVRGRSKPYANEVRKRTEGS